LDEDNEDKNQSDEYFCVVVDEQFECAYFTVTAESSRDVNWTFNVDGSLKL
jgi:hypothetical protein